MLEYKSLLSEVLNLDEKDFTEVALRIFNYQAANNSIYSAYLHHLGATPSQVTDIDKIPFLPIELFKAQKVVTGNWQEQMIFTSSGTVSDTPSKHYIRHLDLYLTTCQEIFEALYGPLSDFHLLALLPGYLERPGSSLIVMMDHFIKKTTSPLSGFYLDNYPQLSQNLAEAAQDHDKTTILWGVSFALLDFSEKYAEPCSRLLIMETGGMKGRREELTREALHQKLDKAFKVKQIHSEYGMAELTSQAYSLTEGRFTTPPWMKVLIRSLDDPLSLTTTNRVGALNIIDLRNIHSCAFIATQDLGRKCGDTFEVLGRMDNSEMRGCNLMVW